VTILARAQTARYLQFALAAGLMLATVLSEAATLSLYALFQDKAIVMVDGQRRILKTGETSPEGIKLVYTDTQHEEAEVEIGGKRERLKLGVVISAFESVSRDVVTLYADGRGHFLADGKINKMPVRFLVDTGATTVAINSSLATRVGINYKAGLQGVSKTASGHVRTWLVKLDTVSIGDIVLRNVDAGVIDGPQPDTPLLGMSFLNALEMKRDGDRMELKRKY